MALVVTEVLVKISGAAISGLLGNRSDSTELMVALSSLLLSAEAAMEVANIPSVSNEEVLVNALSNPVAGCGRSGWAGIDSNKESRAVVLFLVGIILEVVLTLGA